MLFKIIFCIFALIELVQGYDDPITLHPDEIFHSFKSIVSSDYIKVLANEFAAKAAAHMIREMKTKEKNMERDLNTRLRWKQMIHNNMDIDKHESHMSDDAKKQTTQITFEDDHEWNKFHSKETPHLDFKEHVKEPEEPVAKRGDKSPILDEKEAMALLKDPSPDGDNLGDELTDTEAQSESKIPVIGVMKINGVYYRRLLGMI